MADFAGPVPDAETQLRDAILRDESAVAKWRSWGDRRAVPLGHADRVGEALVFSVSPGESLAVGGPPPPDAVDLTHVRAMFRITGAGARAILEHVCAIDLGHEMTPDGAAARTLVAGVATELVRDDAGGEPSYLLLMSRSFARSVWDRLVEVSRPR